MTEYQFCGVLLFGGMILGLFIGFVLDAIDKTVQRRKEARQRRIIKELAKAVKLQQYAKFVAIASSYVK